METKVHDFWFPGKIAPALTASVVDGPWCKADTSNAGTPTLVTAAGFMVGTLANNDEVENLCLYFGDILPYDIDDLIKAEFWMKVSGGGVGGALVAAEQIAWGMASARNDAIDTIAEHASFRLIGAGSTVYCESDDGTNDLDDKSTGQTLSTTMKRFVIDFGGGVRSVSPPPSKGGKAAIQFYMDDSRGNLVRACQSTVFNMENYTGGLQPYVQIQKTGGATTPSFSLRRVRITERISA